MTRQQLPSSPARHGSRSAALATLWCGAIARVTTWLVVAVLTCGVPRAFAQASLQTILTNGPTSNRLNVVELSESYISNELAQFSADATNAVNAILSHPPYQEYSAYFNAYAIKVASSQSGSDHPSWGSYVSTYFSSSYDSLSDILITIPADSTGQGRVDALFQTYMPRCQLPVLLVNDPTPGM